MALHSRCVAAKAEFIAKHDELMSLIENPSRFISSYFSSIRAQINGRYEQLFHQSSFGKQPVQEGQFSFEPEKIQRISNICAWMIDDLNSNENKCIQELASRLSGVNGVAIASLPESASASSGFCSTPSVEGDPLSADRVFSFDVDKEIESLKRLLLDNKSFFFVESERNGFGTLFEFQNRYLTIHEKRALE